MQTLLKTKLEDGQPRKGCVDMWNAFMVSKAEFTYPSDIPICISTADTLPKKLISFVDAKEIYKKEFQSGNKSFFVDAYIHFYIDDCKFDGKQSSIWLYPEKAFEVIKHFAGIITPDFSTNIDFPDPWKRFNTYRMRAFGCWMNQLNKPVINNVRWGTIETWSYCFEGIPKHSIVAIGTVASGLKQISQRAVFEEGLFKMIQIIEPKAIIVYGSSKYPFFDKLRNQGINIVSFKSKTCEVFERRVDNEQNE